MSPRALGGLIAVIVFAADQAVKAAVLSRFTEAGPESTPLTPFIDLALRWNAGISFGLFTQDSPLGRASLLGVTLAATAALGWWLWRCRSKWTAAGLGAIIGGALGNAVDRLAYGAVVDYLDLHAFGQQAAEGFQRLPGHGGPGGDDPAQARQPLAAGGRPAAHAPQ